MIADYSIELTELSEQIALVKQISGLCHRTCSGWANLFIKNHKTVFKFYWEIKDELSTSVFTSHADLTLFLEAKLAWVKEIYPRTHKTYLVKETHLIEGTIRDILPGKGNYLKFSPTNGWEYVRNGEETGKYIGWGKLNRLVEEKIVEEE